MITSHIITYFRDSDIGARGNYYVKNMFATCTTGTSSEACLKNTYLSQILLPYLGQLQAQCHAKQKKI